MEQSFLSEYGLVILFYLSVILLIYFNRKKFYFEGKIIAMYRTKIGLKLMDKIGAKHPKTIKVLGTIGVWVGFIGMILMVYIVIYGLFLLVFRPEAPPMFSPVLPGVTIPGSPIKLPLLEGLISLFVVVVIHEFSHGVVARAYGLPIKSSGFVMFGPLPGAFVEPDEKLLVKQSRKAQLSIFAAGPFSNVLLTIFVLMLIICFSSLTDAIYKPNGIIIDGFVNESDIQENGRLSVLSRGEIIYSVNGYETNLIFNLSDALNESKPGDVIELDTNKGIKQMTLTANPNNESQPYIGIYLNNYMEPQNGVAKVIKPVYFWFTGNPYDINFNNRLGLLGWIMILSVGIGLVNLLPLGPVDGGRMYLMALEKFFSKEVAKDVWSNTAKVLLLFVVILILVPIVKALFLG